MNPSDCKPGNVLIYDDGHPSKRGQCTVLSRTDDSMVVQFDDRADTTHILFRDKRWMNHLTVKMAES